LFDPATNERNLACTELSPLGLGRRHDLVRIIVSNPCEQFAFPWFSGNDGGVTAQVRDRSFAEVKPQVRLALLLIRSVAEEALVGEDGPDIAIELNFL